MNIIRDLQQAARATAQAAFEPAVDQLRPHDVFEHLVLDQLDRIETKLDRDHDLLARIAEALGVFGEDDSH
jgi:hypothetical protein